MEQEIFTEGDFKGMVEDAQIVGVGGAAENELLQLRKENKALKAKNNILKNAKAIPKSASIADIHPTLPDILSLEIGYALLPLIEKKEGAELLEHVPRIPRESFLDLGLVVPRIRIIDNLRLDPNEYSFKIHGVKVGSSRIRMGWHMCMHTDSVTEELSGEATTDPAFGLPAIWLEEGDREKAEKAGYTVVDSKTLIATHLTELIKEHAAEILGCQEVQAIINALKKNYPVVVKEITKLFSISKIRKILQGLLKEQVSIRNALTIFETLADFGSITKETSILVEKVREALGRQICLQYADENQTLHVLTVEEYFLQKLRDSRVDTASGPVAALDPVLQRSWITALSSSVARAQGKGYSPVILCPQDTRILIKASTEREMPNLVVLSVPEIANDIKLETLGEIELGAKKKKKTKAEVEKEFKTMEGGCSVEGILTQFTPELLLCINDMINQSEGRLKKLMLGLLDEKVQEKVVNADVVITNSTGIAIAVLYNREYMQAPIIIAKGKNELGQKMKQIAKKHEVPTIKNPSLACNLYEQVDIEDIIPKEYYTDLATILGKAYALKGKKLG